jgi:hypothetical protein
MLTSKAEHTAQSPRRGAARTLDRRTPGLREERGPDVTSEERRRLAECIAFFVADHHRDAFPETIRDSDVDFAKGQLDIILQHCRRA